MLLPNGKEKRGGTLTKWEAVVFSRLESGCTKNWRAELEEEREGLLSLTPALHQGQKMQA